MAGIFPLRTWWILGAMRVSAVLLLSEELRPEVRERELVAGRGDDEVVAPAALHERVQDARRAGHVLDGQVEALGELGDARPVRLEVVAGPCR